MFVEVVNMQERLATNLQNEDIRTLACIDA